MATQVGSAYELKESRSGGSNIETGERHGISKFRVTFSDASAYSYEAENATGVPVYGAQLGTTKMYVMEKSATPTQADQTLWDVDVVYRTLNPNKLQPNVNPTASTWSVVKSIRSYPTEEPIHKDVNNKPCSNVLGEPMNPPITEVINDQQITITFLSNATSHPFHVFNCIGKTNTDAGIITIGAVDYTYAIGTLYFNDYSVLEVPTIVGTTNTTTMVSQYTYEILGRPGGDWKVRRPNLSLMKSVLSGVNGTMTLASDGTIKTTLILENGTSGGAITEPRFLDAVGQPIPNGGTITMNAFTNKTSSAFFSTLLAGL